MFDVSTSVGKSQRQREGIRKRERREMMQLLERCRKRNRKSDALFLSCLQPGTWASVLYSHAERERERERERAVDALVFPLNIHTLPSYERIIVVNHKSFSCDCHYFLPLSLFRGVVVYIFTRKEQPLEPLEQVIPEVSHGDSHSSISFWPCQSLLQSKLIRCHSK